MDVILVSLLVGLNVIINVSGTYLLKLAAVSGNPVLGILGCACYVFAASLFVLVVKEQPLAVIAVITSVLSLAASSIVGVWAFNENLSETTIIGIVVALLSVVLITLPAGHQ